MTRSRERHRPVDQHRRPDLVVLTYVAALAAAAWVAVRITPAQSLELDVSRAFQFAALVALLAAAEYFFVRFRHRGEISSVNLMEAVLAPLLVTWPASWVVGGVAVAQVISAVARRNAPMKASFNIASWSLAAAAGALVLASLSPEEPSSFDALAALAVALAVVGALNHLAFVAVLSIAQRRSPVVVVRDLGMTLPIAWAIGWSANVVLGLLFTLAYLTQPAAVVLFPIPLLVLHLAYRGYAAAHADRARLAGLHRAARALGGAIQPSEAFERHLREVAEAFEASAAELVLDEFGTFVAYRYDLEEKVFTGRCPVASGSLEHELARLSTPTRISAGHPLAHLLPLTGCRDVLVAPLLDEGRSLGALIVVDQAGLEGFETGELAVVEAFARDVAAAVAKSELVWATMQERQKLSKIVDSTSDGIFTVDQRGSVLTWNPAIAKITGVGADRVRSRGLQEVLDLRRDDGTAVELGEWASAADLPSSLRFVTSEGATGHLSCSYGLVADADDPALVVVARDITPLDEFEELRQRYGELAAAEAAQRQIVQRLQDVFTPPLPAVSDAGLAVCFRASDESAPTGGDLYDWQMLPDGTLHLAVVDVLGHGVAAAKDALTVISTLRLLAFQGCPLEDLVAETDRLLQTQGREVVATVILARFDPSTGLVRVSGGGHPPALVATPQGAVDQLVAPGGALGWPGAGSELTAKRKIWPGDTLVLYTDGVVEATKNILEGLDLLVRNAALHALLPVDEMAAELLDSSLAGADPRDDSLVLMLRCEATAAGSWTVDLSSPAARGLRASTAQWLREAGAPETLRDDCALVLAELVANATNAQARELTCTISVLSSSVVVDVADDGIGFVDLPELDALPSAGPLAERGRGLLIVHTLSTRMEIRCHEGVTRVRAELPWAGTPVENKVKAEATTDDVGQS